MTVYLHALEEELQDIAAGHQALDVVLQSLRQPAQQVQRHDHEVLVWGVVLVRLVNVGLRKRGQISLFNLHIYDAQPVFSTCNININESC